MKAAQKALIRTAVSILCGAAPAAHAANLQISPVTISLSGPVQATTMTLRNTGQEAMYGQVRVYAWSQRDGEDVLAATRDVLATPPMLQIAPGSSQTVRLLRSSGEPVSGEQAYRLIIDEIGTPEASAGSGVQVRLRYSVPVFVGSPAAAPVQPLAWSMVRTGQGWAVRADNPGGSRAQVSAVRLDVGGRSHSLGEGLLGYALAGSYRQWPIDVALRPAQQVSIRAIVNTVPVRATVTTPHP